MDIHTIAREVLEQYKTGMLPLHRIAVLGSLIDASPWRKACMLDILDHVARGTDPEALSPHIPSEKIHTAALVHWLCEEPHRPYLRWFEDRFAEHKAPNLRALVEQTLAAAYTVLRDEVRDFLLSETIPAPSEQN